MNPVVVNGSATFSQAGNVLTVTNSNGAVIHWDKFSIGAGETTHFQQASASSSVLNRVLLNDPSVIYGTLSSNGKVWLINPAGILVGAGGRVDTAAFVASTLNVTNADFLANRLKFDGGAGAGNVVNQGTITTPLGGAVYLLGKNVSNDGIITTPQGETILAAGNTVELIDSATPGIKVEITGAEGNATNLGRITADAGRIGIAGVIVRNSGQLNASSVVSDGGRIFLKASQDAYVDGSGRIVTTGKKGGSIDVLGNRVAVMGQAELDASGDEGGGKIRVGGDYQGKNGEIQNASITYFGPEATLKANATRVGDGGTVIVWADDTTRAYGRVEAKGGAEGGNGGFVETSGKRYLSTDGIRVDTRAPLGQLGTWLLDPENIYIIHGTSGQANVTESPTGYFMPSATGSNSTLTDDAINTALLTTSVAVTTYGASTGTGNIYFASDVSISKTAAIGGTPYLDFNAYGGINVQGTFSNTSGESLRITFNPNKDGGTASNVYTSSGQTATFDGGSGGMEVRIFNGHTWQNQGTVTLNGKSYISLPNIGSYASFDNLSGGILNINSSGQWSFLSDSGVQGGIVKNAGTINVNGTYGGSSNYTAWEALYSQSAGGVLNIGANKILSMQNMDTVYGGVNIGSVGRLNISQVFSGARTFNGATITGPGILDIQQATSFIGSTLSGGILAKTNGDLSVPATGLSYSGNVGFLSSGSVNFLGGSSYSLPGNLTVVAGWDGTTAMSSITGTADATGLTGNTADIVFYGGTSVSASNMTLKASNNIKVGDTYNAATSVTSSGYQKAYAKGNLYVKAGNASNNSTILSAAGAQTLTANSIEVRAGDGSGVYGSSATIRAYGDQVLNVGTQAAGGLSLLSSGPTNTGGYNNQARIEHGSYGGSGFSGNQTINVGVFYGSSLTVTGGAGDGTGGYTSNECASNCQNSNNSAGISNYSGNLTIDFAYGGSLTLTGGTVGTNNYAEINNETSGTLTITGATKPTITITAGTSGGDIGTRTNGTVYYKGNDAGISSSGTTVVYGSNVTLTAGTAATGYANAYIGGGTVYVNATGNIQLTGGGSSSGNATTMGTAAAIGNDKGTTVYLDAYDVTLQGGMNPGSWAMVGSIEQNANVTIRALNNLSLAGATQFANRIGSLASGATSSIALYSGYGGTGAMSLGYGLVDAGVAGTVYLNAGGTGSSIAQSSGSTGGRIRGQTLTVDAAIGPGTAALTGTNRVGKLNATTNGDFSFNGDQITIGTITTTADAVTIIADNAILDDTNSSTRITAANISLTSIYGGASGALAISADTVASTNVSATVTNGTATYGGISIRNYSTAPTFNALNSHAYYGNSVSLYNEASLTLAGASYNFQALGGGAITIYSGGNLNINSPTLATGAGPTYGTVTFGAAGNVSLDAALSKVETLIFAAGGILSLNYAATSTTGDIYALAGSTLDIGSGGSLTARNVSLIAPTINVYGGVTASGGEATPATISSGGTSVSYSGVGFIGKNVTVYGGGYLKSTSATGDISGLVTGVLSLDNGGYMQSGDDIDFVFSSAVGELRLANGSFLHSDYVTNIPATINIDFVSRTSGGIFVNGIETTSNSGSTGFFVLNPAVPATSATGLKVAYAPPATDNLSQTTNSLNSATSAASTSSTPTSSNTPPPPPSSTTGSGSGTGGTGTGTTGSNDEGGFGATGDTGGTGGTGTQSSSNQDKEDSGNGNGQDKKGQGGSKSTQKNKGNQPVKKCG